MADEKREPISFKFVVGGGPFLDFDYKIVGGPDNGKRLTELPERDKEYLDHKYYNGPKEEFMERYVDCRPCWRPQFWSQELHPETIEAATKQFGKICPAYLKWKKELELQGLRPH